MTFIVRDIAEGVILFRILNRVTEKFENFWPIPKGTSYNFYIVRGKDRTALIDGADARFSDEFFRALEERIEVEEIDYVITQHSEPDHSGTLAEVMRRASGAELLGTKQALAIGASLSNYPLERAREIRDSERLELGGKTLRFVVAPMIHWPDTMMTFLEEDRILFTCDLFGSHGASEKVYFDEDDFELADYYASILMPFSAMVTNALQKVRALEPRVLAPSHGALHRHVDPILRTYEDWASWKPKGRALIVVGSQYGNSETLAREAADGLREEGIEATLVDSSYAHPDDLLALTLESSAILIVSSTHNGRPFLGVRYYLDLLEEYKPKNRVFGVIGTFGWGGGAGKYIKDFLESLKIPVVAYMEAKGKPGERELKEAREIGKLLAIEAKKLLK
ncbi:MAG: FprA family A-type flavoprotein [Candidatus Korarchaeum sp.]|nr:FprA family A-type flavoprotein [Candidatus Korarchaeum sp.]